MVGGGGERGFAVSATFSLSLCPYILILTCVRKPIVDGKLNTRQGAGKNVLIKL